jgi:hypothetical protein
MENIGFTIDNLVTLDVRERGVIRSLYAAAAAKAGGRSLTFEAAQRLKQMVSQNDRVLIMTGFVLPPRYVQETDGPLGAASLARALDVARGATPFLLIEAGAGRMVSATCRAIGLNVVEYSRVKENAPKHSAAVIDFTCDLSTAVDAAKELLDEIAPSAVISIEKAGRNVAGEYHTVKGFNVSACHAKVEAIVSEARKRKILTIAVGDGGNEVGMGNIIQTVLKSVPYASKCQCPCGRGIAAESEVDLLVPAAVSNWGAYGIAANLARITGTSALHSPELEESMLASVVREGAIDADKFSPQLAVDGVSIDTLRLIVSLLGKIAYSSS